MGTSYGDVYLRVEDAKTVLPGQWLADQVSSGAAFQYSLKSWS